MSRNLCTDTCVRCGNHTVRLEDFVGQPIEFRSYQELDSPRIGTRWDCPGCDTAYFARFYTVGDCVRCAIRDDDFSGRSQFAFDLSFWATYDDELPLARDEDGEPVLGLAGGTLDNERARLGLGDPWHIVTETTEAMAVLYAGGGVAP